MISSQNTPGIKGVQTFVLANGLLYKAGSQRIGDSFTGRRLELALRNTAIKFWTAYVTEQGFVFGRGTSAVFDDEGRVRSDIAMLALHAKLAGLDVAAYVKARATPDAQVRRFLDLAATTFGQEELAEMAKSAKTLPTR